MTLVNCVGRCRPAYVMSRRQYAMAVTVVTNRVLFNKSINLRFIDAWNKELLLCYGRK